MTALSRPAARRRPRNFTHADRWDAALGDFADTMGRARLAPATVDRVAKHLRKFAADTGTSPYDVTPAHVTAWEETQDCSAAALTAYRTSLRTFYRWATRAGRVLADPTDIRRRHPQARPDVPQAWADALAAFQRWQQAANTARSTQTAYATRLSALQRETGAPTPWDLSADDLADWLARHDWARETLRGHRTALRAFYGWAYDLGHTDDNPAEVLPRVRASTPAPRPAPEDVYADALANADPRARLLLRLAGELGLRRAEVAAVHTRDLHRDDTGAWWLTVRGKGDKLRRLPVPLELATEVRQRGPGYAFPGNERGHLSARRVGELVSDLLPEGVTMHALRHRFATRAYNIDRDVFTVQRLLGHASPATTQLYVQTTDDAMRRLVDAVARDDRMGR